MLYVHYPVIISLMNFSSFEDITKLFLLCVILQSPVAMRKNNEKIIWTRCRNVVSEMKRNGSRIYSMTRFKSRQHETVVSMVRGLCLCDSRASRMGANSWAKNNRRASPNCYVRSSIMDDSPVVYL